MTNDRNPPRDMDEIYRELDELLAGCAGTSLHDQATVGISFCIDERIDTGPQIIGLLRRAGFNARHIGKTLHDLSGADPARHRWQRDEAGHYRHLPSD